MNYNNKKGTYKKMSLTIAGVLVIGFFAAFLINNLNNNQKNKKGNIRNITTVLNHLRFLSGISIDHDSYDLEIGGSVLLTASSDPVILNDNDADRYAIVMGEPNIVSDPDITWISSDPSVATVENGMVTAISNGNAIITANLFNGEMAKCTINVGNTVDVNRIHYIHHGVFTIPSDKDTKGASPANSIVLESNGHFALIDTGLANSNELNPNHADDVLQYLRKIGASKLDFIIITHAHYDHMGGLSDILSNTGTNSVQIDNVYLKPYYSRDESTKKGDYKTRKRFANILKKYYGSEFVCNENCEKSLGNNLGSNEDPDNYVDDYRTALSNFNKKGLYGVAQNNVAGRNMTSTLHKINANMESNHNNVLYLGNAIITLYNTKNAGYYSACGGYDENSNSVVVDVQMGSRTALIAGDMEKMPSACYRKVYGNPYENCSKSDTSCSFMDDFFNDYDKSIDLYELTHHGYSSCDMSEGTANMKIYNSKIVISNWKEKIDYYYCNFSDTSKCYNNLKGKNIKSCKDNYFNNTYYNNSNNYYYVENNNLVFDFTDGGYSVYTNN